MLSFLKIIITELIVGNYSEPSIKIDIIINGINLLINITNCDVRKMGQALLSVGWMKDILL